MKNFKVNEKLQLKYHEEQEWRSKTFRSLYHDWIHHPFDNNSENKMSNQKKDEDISFHKNGDIFVVTQYRDDSWSCTCLDNTREKRDCAHILQYKKYGFDWTWYRFYDEDPCFELESELEEFSLERLLEECTRGMLNSIIEHFSWVFEKFETGWYFEIICIEYEIIFYNRYDLIIEYIANTKQKELYLNEENLFNYYEVEKISIPPNIEKLLELELLEISDVEIEGLPENIGKLCSLRYLRLTNNCLKRLPESIGKLSTLEELTIKYNELIELPETINGLRSLKKMCLYGNNLATLPKSICELKSLEHIDLSNNSINRLPESLLELNSLKTLKIDKESLKLVERLIKKLKKKGVKIIYW